MALTEATGDTEAFFLRVPCGLCERFFYQRLPRRRRLGVPRSAPINPRVTCVATERATPDFSTFSNIPGSSFGALVRLGGGGAGPPRCLDRGGAGAFPPRP